MTTLGGATGRAPRLRAVRRAGGAGGAAGTGRNPPPGPARRRGADRRVGEKGTVNGAGDWRSRLAQKSSAGRTQGSNRQYVVRSVVSLSTPTGSPTARRGRAWSRGTTCAGRRDAGAAHRSVDLGAGGAGAAAGGTSGCSGSPIKPSPHAKSPGAPSPYTLCGHVAAGYMCTTPAELSPEPRVSRLF